jgi:hypothetical protein
MRWSSGQIRSSYWRSWTLVRDGSSTETAMMTGASDTCLYHLAVYPVFSKNDGKGHAMSFCASWKVCLAKGEKEEKMSRLTL